MAFRQRDAVRDGEIFDARVEGLQTRVQVNFGGTNSMVTSAVVAPYVGRMVHRDAVHACPFPGVTPKTT